MNKLLKFYQIIELHWSNRNIKSSIEILTEYIFYQFSKRFIKVIDHSKKFTKGHLWHFISEADIVQYVTCPGQELSTKAAKSWSGP